MSTQRILLVAMVIVVGSGLAYALTPSVPSPTKGPIPRIQEGLSPSTKESKRTSGPTMSGLIAFIIPRIGGREAVALLWTGTSIAMFYIGQTTLAGISAGFAFLAYFFG